MASRSDSMPKVQCQILAAMEEAGEEDTAALINTIGLGQGNEEVRKFADALAALLAHGYLYTAVTRKKMYWEERSTEESMTDIAHMERYLSWNHDADYWQWVDEKPRMQIVLTDSGQALAEELLRMHGWGIIRG